MDLFFDLLRSVIYGVIEGITEWLPISSTGHMILAEQVLKFSFSAEFMEMFRVVIQLGAILAVVVMYFKKLWPFCVDNGRDSGLAKHVRWPVMRLWFKIIVACLPAAVLGLALDDWIDAHFYNSVVVAVMLIVYGIAFILIERRPRVPTTTKLSRITYRQALLVGAWQVLALIPGTSRSGSTIIGGMLCGGIVAKIRKMNLFAVLDVASLGYLIGQGVGRWGNFVNQEAFGCATDLPWGMYSDRTAAEVVGNVHPCFLYESILCLLGFVLLHLFTRRLRRYDGQTFLLYIIWYGVTRFFIEGLRTDSLLLPGIDLRVSQVLAAASALVAVVLLIVFRNCHKLTGCGSRKAMEAAGLTVEDKVEKVEIDDTAESTIFSGMSAEEAQEHMTVGTGVKKAAEAENEKTEGNADANTSEEPSDEAEEANETAEGESEEKNDGSEN